MLTAPMPTLIRHCPQASDTDALGAALAAALRAHRLPPLLLTLRGDLGAGKTSLVRALLRALGVAGRIKSPTYALVETYRVANSLQFNENLENQVYHVDLYRFSSEDDWHDAGLRELLDGRSLCLVEWPERAPQLVPRADVDIVLEPSGEGRIVRLHSGSAEGSALLDWVAAHSA